MKARTTIILAVAAGYGMFMILAVLIALGMLDDALQGYAVDDFRPIVFVGVGGLSAGMVALIILLAPRGRATPLAAITLAGAYGLLYLTDQHILPAFVPENPGSQLAVLLTGSFITLAHASVFFVEYFRGKLEALHDDE